MDARSTPADRLSSLLALAATGLACWLAFATYAAAGSQVYVAAYGPVECRGGTCFRSEAHGTGGVIAREPGVAWVVTAGHNVTGGEVVRVTIGGVSHPARVTYVRNRTASAEDVAILRVAVDDRLRFPVAPVALAGPAAGTLTLVTDTYDVARRPWRAVSRTLAYHNVADDGSWLAAPGVVVGQSGSPLIDRGYTVGVIVATGVDDDLTLAVSHTALVRHVKAAGLGHLLVARRTE